MLKWRWQLEQLQSSRYPKKCLTPFGCRSGIQMVRSITKVILLSDEGIPMDKAAVLGDAFVHIQKLDRKVQEMELKIKGLEDQAKLLTGKNSDPESSRRCFNHRSREFLSPSTVLSGCSAPSGASRILDVKPTVVVSTLEHEAIIRLHCMNESYPIANLMFTLDELKLQVQHANFTPLEDSVFRCRC